MRQLKLGDEYACVEGDNDRPNAPAGMKWDFKCFRGEWAVWHLIDAPKQVIMCDDPQMLKVAIETVHENGPLPPVDEPLPALSTHALARKNTPVFSGCLAYFPRALAAVAALSQIGNEQHNPGTPLHWDRSKSGDEWDALARHLLEVGSYDTDGVRHATKVAWRALAGLQKELERDSTDARSGDATADAGRGSDPDEDLGPGC